MYLQNLAAVTSILFPLWFGRCRRFRGILLDSVLDSNLTRRAVLCTCAAFRASFLAVVPSWAAAFPRKRCLILLSTRRLRWPADRLRFLSYLQTSSHSRGTCAAWIRDLGSSLHRIKYYTCDAGTVATWNQPWLVGIIWNKYYPSLHPTYSSRIIKKSTRPRIFP